jgi:hypothetical protein
MKDQPIHYHEPFVETDHTRNLRSARPSEGSTDNRTWKPAMTNKNKDGDKGINKYIKASN